MVVSTCSCLVRSATTPKASWSVIVGGETVLGSGGDPSRTSHGTPPTQPLGRGVDTVGMTRGKIVSTSSEKAPWTVEMHPWGVQNRSKVSPPLPSMAK